MLPLAVVAPTVQRHERQHPRHCNKVSYPIECDGVGGLAAIIPTGPPVRAVRFVAEVAAPYFKRPVAHCDGRALVCGVHGELVPANTMRRKLLYS